MPDWRLVVITIAVAGFSLMAKPAYAEPRRLAVPAENLIAVELATVGVAPMSGTPVVVLREPASGSTVPIFIGPNEARAIVTAQRAVAMPRPMTHDLAKSLLDALGGRLEAVIVDELRDGTYFGALEVVKRDGQRVLIDSRPSDGLALAVRADANILVAPDVLEANAAVPFEGLGGAQEVVTALGITVMRADKAVREALGLPDQTGVLVTVARGLASLAGVEPGALILEVNDKPVATPMAFLEGVNATPRGQNARLRFQFGGEIKTISLDVGVPAVAPDRERRDSL
jgi:bifunctional DNase/RNase